MLMMKKNKVLWFLMGTALCVGACSEDMPLDEGGMGGGSAVTPLPEVTAKALEMSTYNDVVLSVETPVSTALSVYADEEGSQPLVSGYYAVEGGDNEVAFSVANHVKTVYVAYATAAGREVAPVSLAYSDEKRYTLADYMVKGTSLMYSVPCRESLDGNPDNWWHEHWTKGTDGDVVIGGWSLEIHYDDCGVVDNDEERTVAIDKPANSEGDGTVYVGVKLGEDAVKSYETSDEGYTAYHSSGVVMFSASWPYGDALNPSYREDFNDVVIDYDMESLVFDENGEGFAAKDWKEGLKVVMHVRAVGSNLPASVGLKLEGLSKEFVQSSEVTLKLAGNDANVEADVPEGSLTASLDYDEDCPVIRIHNLQWLLSEVNTANHPQATLYNTERESKEAWLEDGTDYINHGAQLFTLTVNLKGALRSGLENVAEGNAQVEAYKRIVTKTYAQNFFITTKDGTEIHLCGYDPLSGYDYDAAVANGSVTMSPDTRYKSAKNTVWAVKVPTLTKHIYEKESFIATFPRIAEWISSNGKSAQDWYLPENADETNWVKWW